jgi:DnaJ-class molecular chaperone
MRATITCKQCRGRGLVPYNRVTKSKHHKYLEVARECPGCDGRGEIARPSGQVVSEPAA